MNWQTLGNLDRGLLFVLSAPAGTGKTTLVERLVQQNPCIVKSISTTTREPRGQERHGVDYFFVNPEQFTKQIEDKQFLEHVQLYGHYYGTSALWVEEQRSQGKHVILVIDTQGANQLRSHIDATYIFLLPPSLQALQQRLEGRKTEPESAIAERLLWSRQEFIQAAKYDYLIVNENIDTAYQVLRNIISAEEHKAANVMANSHRPDYLKN